MDDQTIRPNRYNSHAWILGEPTIGEGTWIGAFTLVDGRGGLTIGRGCDISSGAHLLSHSSAWRCVTERAYNRVDECPTVLEDHVFVGESATILMGAHIGHHSIVAAGSVVLENTVVPPYSLVAGVPARLIRSIRDEIGSCRTMGALGMARPAATRLLEPTPPRPARGQRRPAESPRAADASTPRRRARARR